MLGKWSKKKAVLGAEILIGILMVINLVRPCLEIFLSANELSNFSSSETKMVDGKEVLYTFHNDGQTLVNLDLQSLHFGAYQVEIQYDSDYYYQNDETIEEDMDLIKKVAAFQVRSDKMPAAVSSLELPLRDGEQKAVSQFWIEPGYRTDDIHGEITFYGKGEIGIYSLRIREMREFRFLCLLFYLLVVVFLEFAYRVKQGKLFPGKKKTILILFGILLVSSIPINFQKVLMCDDVYYHLNRMFSIVDSIKSGQFPNRIQQNMMYGYGYLDPVFYGEILLYLPAALICLGAKGSFAFGIYNVFINALTVGISYFCMKKMFQEERACLLGTMLYVLSPYRMVDLYSRVALGEYSAWTFLPLIVYGVWKFYQKEKTEKITRRECLPLVLGMTGIIQTHILTCEMTATILFLFCLITWKKTFTKNVLWAYIRSVCIVLLLNAWFLIPFLDSMRMNLNVFQEESWLIQEKGLSWNSLFSTSFGPVGRFYLGEAGLIVLFTGLIFFGQKKVQYTEKKIEIRTAKFALGFSVLTLYLSSQYFPYDRICSWSGKLTKLICMIQFPWRFLMFATLFLAIALAAVVQTMKQQGKESIWNAYTIGIGFVMLLGALITNSGYVGGREIDTVNETCIDNVGNGEYLLVGTDASRMYDTELVCSEGLKVYQYHREKDKYVVEVNNESDVEGKLLVPLWNYDHYVVTSGEGEIQFHETGDNNRMLIHIPASYQGVLSIQFKPPVVWRIAEVVSLISFLWVCCLGIQAKGNLGKKERETEINEKNK